MKEENLTIDQIAEMIHKAIDNTAMAEDEYPDIKERLHEALESERERLMAKKHHLHLIRGFSGSMSL